MAGFVDATGFLHLGGFFVSFMSGNSTRAGVGLVTHARDAAIAGGLILTFVSGVVAGTLTGHFAPSHRKRTAVLALVALLLALAAISGNRVWAPVLMAFAMGAANIVLASDGEVSFGVTYMTGALVKLGQQVGGALLGRERFGWFPYLVLWTGLLGGAATGAALFPLIGMQALWVPALAAILLLPFVEQG